jgi:glyoxylase-like metal-dependent hydrolase (beta-lactamase superfamily II)
VKGRDVDAMMAPCPVDRRLEDGDRFEMGGRTFEVLHTPGHTVGSAIYLDPESGFAVTGDTILQNITPNALSVQREETGALARYLQTLERLRERALGTMIPGHGPAFTGAEATIDRAFRLYHGRRQRIIGFLEDAPGPVTVWEVVEHEWPQGQKGAAFLMTSEIQGHLDILVADGLVSVTEPEERRDGGSSAQYTVHRGPT